MMRARAQLPITCCGRPCWSAIVNERALRRIEGAASADLGHHGHATRVPLPRVRPAATHRCRSCPSTTRWRPGWPSHGSGHGGAHVPHRRLGAAVAGEIRQALSELVGRPPPRGGLSPRHHADDDLRLPGSATASCTRSARCWRRWAAVHACDDGQARQILARAGLSALPCSATRHAGAACGGASRRNGAALLLRYPVIGAKRSRYAARVEAGRLRRRV